ncbi:MAG: ECF transporter S component [Bacilli bacterium]|nr:ECF transporter S component [Bacilli bacterium]
MNSDELKNFMGWFKWVMMGLLILIVIGLFILSYFNYKKKKINPVKFITVTGIFGALAVILYVAIPDFGLGFTPPWLKVHLDEIPMFLAGYMYGPIAALMVDLIKTLVKLPMSSTACVGEIGDFIFSLVFVLPAVLIYERKRKLSSVFIGFGVSTVAQIIFAMLMNVYFMIPFYSMLYGLPESVLEGMCTKIIPAVQGENWKWLYASIMVAPMNAIKDSIVIVVVLLLYKRLHILINRIGSQTVKQETKEEVTNE